MTCIRPFVVVAAVDGSTTTASVLTRALQAAVLRSDHEVHVIRVHQDRTGELEELLRQLESDVADVLDNFQGGPHGQTVWRIRTHAAIGIPNEEVASLAAEVEAHLIVVGTRAHQEPARPGRAGPTPDGLLRLAGCPVLVVRPIPNEQGREVEADGDGAHPSDERTWRGAA